MADFKIIKGTFHIVGYQPDGDSIRFQADRPEAWAEAGFAALKPTKKNPKIQLRLEAIDALETHYEGYHQPRSFAIGALEKLLALLEIEVLAYSINYSITTKAHDGKPGFIAFSEIDGFDRPIAFAFPATAPLIDGGEMTAEDLPVERSVNFQVCAEGLVYPTFYTTTPPVFVQKFGDAAREARLQRRGIWVIDRTADFTVWDPRSLYEDFLILPKLFRRLVSFFENYSDFSELPKYMKANGDKILLADGSQTTFDKIVKVEGRRLKMTMLPEDIFFFPKA